MNDVIIDLQIASNANTLPHPSQFKRWVCAALAGHSNDVELTIRIVDTEEIIDLNSRFRKNNQPTNVLAFPYEDPPGIILPLPLLGDIIICAPIVETESHKLKKNTLSHWAHLVVHGTLHLLGYDHITNPEAEEMESLETEILVKMGFVPPYGVQVKS